MGRTSPTWPGRDLSQLVIVQPDDRLMEICADLRVEYERAGHALGQKLHEAERWIAATSKRLGVPLVSDDSVFVDVSGLLVLLRSSRIESKTRWLVRTSYVHLPPEFPPDF